MSNTAQTQLLNANIIPHPFRIKNLFPLDAATTQKVAQNRKNIGAIISGESERKLLIIGPCSAFPDFAVLEYAEKLMKIRKEVEKEMEIVMRVYIQKPRTTVGWAGPVMQPDPTKAPDIHQGILYSRAMMLEIAKMGMPIADELLFGKLHGYFDDLLSYSAIGARSSEDADHRYLASNLPHAVGMKNPTSGSIQIGVNGVVAAKHQHPNIKEIHLENGVVELRSELTKGNPHAHLILRGGANGTNYDYESMKMTVETMKKANIEHPAFIVDSSHDNCVNKETGLKEPLKQPEIVLSTIENAARDVELFGALKGWLVESFLHSGNQPVPKNSLKEMIPGLSITDPCVGFEAMSENILKIRDLLDSRKKVI